MHNIYIITIIIAIIITIRTIKTIIIYNNKYNNSNKYKICH